MSSTWVNARFEIMVEATYAKFSQKDSLCDYLIGTGDHVLVEASPQDRIGGSVYPLTITEQLIPGNGKASISSGSP